MKRVWKNYSLGILLASLFLISWGAQALTGWQEFKAEQATHDEPSHWFSSDGYVWYFLHATLENWQSEFLQLLTFVVLTTYFIYKNSHESRDGQDEMKSQLDRIERQLKSMEPDKNRRKAG